MMMSYITTVTSKYFYDAFVYLPTFEMCFTIIFSIPADAFVYLPTFEMCFTIIFSIPALVFLFIFHLIVSFKNNTLFIQCIIIQSIYRLRVIKI